MREKDRLLRQEAAAEAVLFTMGRAVELRELSAALETGEEEAQAAVERLREKYREEGRGLSIIELSGSFQMCTKAEYYENLIRVAKALLIYNFLLVGASFLFLFQDLLYCLCL